VRCLLVLSLLLGGVAHAGPPSSGSYHLLRQGPAAVYQGAKSEKQRIPDCKLAESIPIPLTLEVEYSRASPIVVVNDEDWNDGDLTTNEDGTPQRFPLRIANKPNPPPKIWISVLFRADGKKASGIMIVSEYDADGNHVCVVARNFTGTYDRR
jgi:hypothetical protein